MEKDTLRQYTYNELIALYRAIREEIRRREDKVEKFIVEKPYGTD